MRRGARLHAITDYLRRRRTSVTVPELAARFRVTERTVHRDLAELRDQGLPVEGEPGRGGGLRLSDHHSMPPLALTLEEAVGLWVSVRLGAIAGPLPAHDAVQRAADKVFAALPVDRRRALDRLLRRVVVGIPAGEHLAREAKPVPAATFRACEAAFTQARALRLSYVDRFGARSARTVEPHGLLVQAPLWYVLAVDRERGAPRMFRMDRIAAARVEPSLPFDPRDPRELFAEIAAHRLELKG